MKKTCMKMKFSSESSGYGPDLTRDVYCVTLETSGAPRVGGVDIGWLRFVKHLTSSSLYTFDCLIGLINVSLFQAYFSFSDLVISLYSVQASFVCMLLTQ